METGLNLYNVRTDEKCPAAKRTYPKGWNPYSKDSFEVNQTLVFKIKF